MEWTNFKGFRGSLASLKSEQGYGSRNTLQKSQKTIWSNGSRRSFPICSLGSSSFGISEQLAHLFGRFPLHGGRDVRVCVECQADLGMAQNLMDDLGMHALREQQGGGGVAQVVEADIRQARCFELLLEIAHLIARRVGGVVSGGEEQPGLFFSPRAVGFEGIQHKIGHADWPFGFIRLGLGDEEPLANQVLHGAADMQRAALPVNILVREPQHLSDPQCSRTE